MFTRKTEHGESNTRVRRPNNIKCIVYASLASVTLYDINPLLKKILNEA